MIPADDAVNTYKEAWLYFRTSRQLDKFRPGSDRLRPGGKNHVLGTQRSEKLKLLDCELYPFQRTALFVGTGQAKLKNLPYGITPRLNNCQRFTRFKLYLLYSFPVFYAKTM